MPRRPTGAEELWCLGDLVGYGAEPDACVALADAHCAICLAGNHDLAVSTVLSLDDFSRGAALAAQWTRERDPAARRASSCCRCQPQGAARGSGCSTPRPRDPVWEYVLSRARRPSCASTRRLPDLLHRPLARGAVLPPARGPAGDGHRAPRGRPSWSSQSGEWLINPGRVGQPRDGDPRAAWLMLDTGEWTAAWRRAEYDIAGAAGRDPRGAACPTRSPSASNTGNERRGGR